MKRKNYEVPHGAIFASPFLQSQTRVQPLQLATETPEKRLHVWTCLLAGRHVRYTWTHRASLSKRISHFVVCKHEVRETDAKRESCFGVTHERFAFT
jgi:hypothetical protein